MYCTEDSKFSKGYHRNQDKITLCKIQTQTCAQRLAAQQNKNAMLKSSLINFQNKIADTRMQSSKEVSLSFAQSTKLRNKLEYDLQQIIQKYNQSQAQINEIKVQVNIARSQRVVYSNIFKDLQKQIKCSDKTLKRLILKNCKMKQQLGKFKQKLRSVQPKVDQYGTTPNQIVLQSIRFKQKNSKKKQVQEIQRGKQAIPNRKSNNKTVLQINQCQSVLDKFKAVTGLQPDQFQTDLALIDTRLHQTYQKINQLNDKIDNLKKSRQTLQSSIKDKGKLLQKNLSLLKSKRKDQPNQKTISLVRQLQIQSSNIRKYLQFFYGLAQQLGLQRKPIEQISQDQIIPFISNVQKSINELLFKKINIDQEGWGFTIDTIDLQSLQKSLQQIQDRANENVLNDRVLEKKELDQQVLRMFEEIKLQKSLKRKK